MSIQDILEKILTNAKNERDTILRKAKEEAEILKKEILSNGMKKVAELEEKTDDKISKTIKKSEYLAHMKGKNSLLEDKKTIIEDILSIIVEKLSSMPAKEYEQFLAKMMREISIEEGIIYPAKGKENSTKGAVKLNGKKFQIGESKDIAGGFIVDSEFSNFDFSFETLVRKTYRKNLEEIIISTIFKQN